MEFKVVPIPEKASTDSVTGKIRKSLLDNIGQAVEIYLGERDANSYRKILRASLNANKSLEKYNFRTLWVTSRDAGEGLPRVRVNILMAWLEEKSNG